MPVGTAAVWMLLLVMLASCGFGSPTQPPEITSGLDLVEAIRGAGKHVEETDEVGLAAFGVEGRIYRVEEATLHLYAYPSAAERESVSKRLSREGEDISGMSLPWSDTPYVWASGPLLVVYPGADGGMVLLLEGLLGDPLTRAGVESEAPYPPAVTAAIEWLADSRSISPEVVEVVAFEAGEWSDSCLGLPAKGEVCEEGEIIGWTIEMKVQGERVRVRTGELGEPLRWESTR